MGSLLPSAGLDGTMAVSCCVTQRRLLYSFFLEYHGTGSQAVHRYTRISPFFEQVFILSSPVLMPFVKLFVSEIVPIVQSGGFHG